MSAEARPVVIGAGWSGLAAAIAFVERGFQPIVVEAGPQAGGRARAVTHALGDREFVLDNGQHLFVGAYRETLRLMHAVGVDAGAVLERLPFTVAYPDGWRLAAARRRAPWHLGLALLRARGMTLRERWDLARWTRARQRDSWQAPEGDAPASTLFDAGARRTVRRLWRPLCLAALNVELEHASARMLLAVLRDTLGAAEPDSNLLLARTGLSAVFPEPAVRWLRARGADVRLHCPVLGLHAAPRGGDVQLQLRGQRLAAGRVVLALPPARVAALVEGLAPESGRLARGLHAIPMAPICTSYLRYPAGTRLASAFLALADDPARERFGQWVFDRGAMDPALAGVMAVVTSGAGVHMERSGAALSQAVAVQLTAQLGLPQPLAHFTIMEKQATLVPAPGLQRPGVRLPLARMYLAGDAADSDYPSTLEGSVRAGVRAAQAAIEDIARGR